MMLSVKAATGAGDEAHHLHGDRVTGNVGFAGDAVTGSVYLHCSQAFSAQATTAMLGLSPEEITSTEVNDVIGEVTNMLAGGLKSWLCDAGATCVLTIPSVIRGTSFEINSKPGVDVVLVGYDCGAHKGLVEIHIKFT